MLKNIFITLLIFVGLAANAADNYLNSIIIDNIDGGTSIVLRSDSIAKIKREVESSDKIVLTLKNISQSPNLNTLYKNTSKVDGLMVQSEKPNELKVYIQASDIAKAKVIFETPNSSPITVTSATSEGRVAWSVISIALLLLIMRSARNVKPRALPNINEVIKEREKALYRNFQKEISVLPSMNYKLKGYSKHVLKGETIRSYENRMSVKI